jgi:alpha-N-arabinofuranosidase
VRIEVDAHGDAGPIHDHLYGHNHVWIRGGNGVWDLEAHTPNRPVIEALRPMGVTLLRFPGGTLSHRYEWEPGIGPPEKRPLGNALSSMSTFSNGYGTFEFLEVCRQLGADPLLVANWDEGSPQSTAAWLALLNGAPDAKTPIGKDAQGRDWGTVGQWGRKRVELGHPETVGLRFFEIGNEMYWKRFPQTPQSCAERFIEYSRLLKTVDPEIRVGIVGFHKPEGPGWLDAEEGRLTPWNRTVLEKAGGHCDFLTVHIYRGLEDEVDDGYPDLIIAPVEVEADLRAIRRIASEVRGDLPPVELAITEYNAMIAAPGIQRFSPRMVTLEAALYNASLLLAFARTGVEMGSFHILCLYPPDDPALAGGINFAALAIHPDRMVMTPTYHVLSMLSSSFRGKLLPVESTFHPLGEGGRGQEIAILDVAAASPREGEVTVAIVNRSLSREIPVEIRLTSGRPVGLVRQEVLTSGRISDDNSDRVPRVVPRTVYPVARDDGVLPVVTPPASLSVVRLSVQGR